MFRRRNRRLLLTIVITTIIIILAGCHFPAYPWVQATITSHEDGDRVILGEETMIITLARGSQGIEHVELYEDGILLDTLSPTEEEAADAPFEIVAEQTWIPLEEGPVVISVIAVDSWGTRSESASVTLDVVLTDEDIEPTPTPTATPEGLELTQTAQAGCTNEANFLEHVTIPIDIELTGGSNFTKIWRVNNSGTCDWIGYRIVHTSGERFNADSPKALPVVNAGSNADIAIDMVAPITPGTYTSTWRISAEDGTVFGPDLVVTIIIPQLPTDTPTPTPTSTPTPTATPVPISIVQVTEQISIPPNSNRNTTANCPSGSVVVSGGYAGAQGVRIWHSTKIGNGWRVDGRNNTASAQLMNVYAMCLTLPGASTSQELIQMDANPNDITQLEISCPANTVVTGGGFDIGATDPIDIYHSSMSGSGWQIYINNRGGETPSVNAYAVCLAGVPGTTSQVSQTQEPIPPNNTAQLVSTCPGNTLVTGGGFAVNLGATVFNTSRSDNGWQNFARNHTDTQKLLNTYAICYSP